MGNLGGKIPDDRLKSSRKDDGRLGKSH